jgi:integrase/recombinase XerC
VAEDPVLRHLQWMTQRGLSPNTIEARRGALRRTEASIGMPLLGATPEILETWRASLHRLTPTTISLYVGNVRQFYAWAASAGLITTSPARRIPAPRRPRRLPRPIGEEMLLEVLDAAPQRIRLWLVLAAWCGLRAQEIAYLRCEDIALGAHPPALTVSSEAAKGDRERIIPLCSFAVAEIAAAGLPLHGWAFTRRDGQPGPNRPWQVSHLANKHLHDCGSTATLHTLRHRFGTQAYRGRRDLRAVQELMGHASPVTTAIYTAFDRPEALAAVESMPSPLRLRAVPLDEASSG